MAGKYKRTYIGLGETKEYTYEITSGGSLRRFGGKPFMEFASITAEEVAEIMEERENRYRKAKDKFNQNFDPSYLNTKLWYCYF